MQHDVITHEARRLNENGQVKFREYFDGAGRRETAAPPVHLLTDPDYSETIYGVGPLPVAPATKFEMAAGINAALGDRRVELMFDEGFWNAMVLRYVDQVVPCEDGVWVLRNSGSYVMTGRDALYSASKLPIYRHRVWGPCYLHGMFGEDCRPLLAKDIAMLGDGLDALLYYNQPYKSVVQAINLLYWNKDSIVGDADLRVRTPREGNLRHGNIRDFIEHSTKVGYTKSLHRISPIELIADLSPEEFGPYIANAKARIAANDLPPSMLMAA